MKRSEMISLVQNIVALYRHASNDIMSNKVLADVILFAIEDKGMHLVDDMQEATSWEPEEGWDAYFIEQDKKDQARDFQIKDKTIRRYDMVQSFLNGKSFEELASEYNVTRERVRQIVCKERRKYQKIQEITEGLDSE